MIRSSSYRKYVETSLSSASHISTTASLKVSEPEPSDCRPLVLNFEKGCRNLRNNDVGLWWVVCLLAAPVVTQGTTTSCLSARGCDVVRFLDGRKMQRRSVYHKAPLDTMPLFVRAGAVLPIYPLMQYVGEVEDLTQFANIGNYIHYPGRW